MSDEKAFEERNDTAEDETFKVDDRRHWQQESEEAEAEAEAAADDEQPSGIIERYRERTEEAERKLLEYIDAFKRHQAEQERVRERLARDVQRRVELQFGEVVGELLLSLDDLDRSLEHVREVEAARPLAEGVAMARDRFLATLAQHGVERISPEGQRFDPNEAEAMRVDPVEEAERDGIVTETLQPGYRLGKRIIRAAKVAVAGFKKS
jgi:molecular chaperone GrpE